MRNRLLLVRTALVGALSLGVVALQGQVPPQTPPTQAPAVAEPEAPRVALTVNRSRVLRMDFDIARVSITNPAVADVTVVDTRELLLDGKAPGTVSLIVWSATTYVQYDVVVDPGVTGLQRQIQTIFPGEQITAAETAETVILTGRASNNTVMLRVGELAEAMVPKAKVINLLQLPGGNGSQQVMLQVRVAEVNRRAVSELGTALFTGGVGYKDVIARGTTQQFAAPGFDNLKATYDKDGNLISSSGENTFSDFLNLFLFSNKYDVGILIKALETNGNLQSLAEPNLVAYNGQEASFLAGGELPVPLVQGTTGQVSIEYKEFGVRLNFRPTIAGDVIRLKVRPEVSSLDFANGITLNGFRVPAIVTRRAETDVELRDGQSFAIAGLLNNVSQESRQEIPLLSKIPLIGHLFKSRANTQDRTELMVLVTPHLVGPLNPDEVPPLPTMPDKFLPPCNKPPCDVVPAKKGSGG